jgi:hypothetical protein
MFSANENLILRQAKKRVVGFVEECLPDGVLDLGANVMVMQVSCTAPGCVPLETAIIVVFPPSAAELLPGLKESAGGSYKTKVLLPLSEVTKQDVMEALPPSFPGGLRTTEKLCLSARDVMLAKIVQLFGDEDDESSVDSRRLMARYLQSSLQEYIDRGCIAPQWGEPFPPLEGPAQSQDGLVAKGTQSTSEVAEGDATKVRPSTSTVGDATEVSQATLIGSFLNAGNVVIRRPLDDDDGGSAGSGALDALSSPLHPSPAGYGGSLRRTPTVNTRTALRQQQSASLRISATGDGGGSSSSSALLSRLLEREQHAPGIRRAGCPCCDPDNPSNVIDQMMLL